MCWMTQEAQPMFCDNLEGGMGWEVGGGRDVQEEEDIADSCWCMAKT